VRQVRDGNGGGPERQRERRRERLVEEPDREVIDQQLVEREVPRGQVAQRGFEDLRIRQDARGRRSCREVRRRGGVRGRVRVRRGCGAKHVDRAGTDCQTLERDRLRRERRLEVLEVNRTRGQEGRTAGGMH